MAGLHDTDKPHNGARPDGLLVVDKPPGPTSYDVIRFLRRTCGIDLKWKVGHLGTLDPFASGVVVVALGQAVKYAEYALHSRKQYRARLWLGDETDTLDVTGKVVRSEPVPQDWRARLPEIACEFIGTISQVPPAFSAKQVDGRRAYKSARKGEPVELKPASVTIYSIALTYVDECCVDFVCEVSGGTYIRSLGRDIAHALGTVGHLVGLERLAVGPFDHMVSIPFEAFELGGLRVLEHHLRPVDAILEQLPSVTLSASDEVEEKLAHGKLLDIEDFEGELPLGLVEKSVVRIMGPDGHFRALGRMKSGGGISPFKQWVYPS